MNAILFTPSEGDPHDVLAPVLCGGSVPLARLDDDDQWVAFDPEHYAAPDAKVHTGVALVLAWDGAAVAEGCDRAVRAYNKAAKDSVLGIQDEYTLAGALFLAKAVASKFGGSVVVLE